MVEKVNRNITNLMKNPARVAVENESREKETIRIKETDIKETLVFILRSKCMDGHMKKKQTNTLI